MLAIAIGRLRGEEQMRHEALHDPLTGLANRALCRDRSIHALARTERDGGAACRAVHRPRRLQARQRPLRPRGGRRAADRARAAGWSPRCARPTPSRGSAATSSWSSARTSTSAPRSRSAGASPRRSTSRSTSTASSTGCRRASGSRSAAARRDATPTRCSADADAAAYRAKARGPRARRGLRRAACAGARAERCGRPRRSSARSSARELELVFQPIVSLADGATVGHEALLRWDAPGGVMIGAGRVHPGRRGVRR